MIRKAEYRDVDAIAGIYERVLTEEENGNSSVGWMRGVYPTRKTAEDAIARGDLFVLEVENKIVASAVINQIQVPEYADCPWKYEADDTEIMVLHTLTVNPLESGKGYGKQFVNFYENYALEHECHYLRMDTQSKNTTARKLYNKLGYAEPGMVYCVFNGIPNVELVCLEKKI